MQFPGQGKPAIGIVFDAGWDRIDDVLALALLHGFDGKSESRIAALSVSEYDLNAARLCDAIERFYAGTGPFAAFFRGLAVGLSTVGKTVEGGPMVTKPLAEKSAFSTGIKSLNDTADPAPLIRNALTAQHDANALVVMTGSATNLAGTLALEGTRDLIARKVKYLVIAANGPAPDVGAARKVLADWPTPIVFAGPDVGVGAPFPGASIEKDFAWSPAHPVVEAYRAYKPMPYDAPTWSMAAVLHAVRPQEGYFKVSEPGRLAIGEDGRVQFTAGAEGTHRQLVFDPEQRERIVKAYVELASAKPVQRRPRFLQDADAEKKKEAEKGEKKPQP
jgi:hypothetical protein